MLNLMLGVVFLKKDRKEINMSKLLSGKEKLIFKWYKFSELSVEQLYAVLMVRSEVFVVEQQCYYLDPDGKDSSALHLLGTRRDSSLAVYLRLFPPTADQDYVLFGRVVTHPSARNAGYGKMAMQELLSYCNQYLPSAPIKCSAQHHLIKFYAEFGFQPIGDVYDEDGIPHIAMEKK